MTTQLSDHLAVRGRFARSIRLDKDAGHAEKLDGYLPTGRSLEVVRRLTHALGDAASTRVFSITGPYGSGKSSLALFIDALLGRGDEDAHRAAVKLIETYDPETGETLTEARQQLGVATTGVIRAVITAPQREPITTTVLRALDRGASQARISRKVRHDISEALERAESSRYASPSHQEIRELLERLCERRPVLLIIDEFGKNLEAFAESGREGDLYLLQELAEWASGAVGLPLVVMTIQHLAFESYVEDATTTQRREWAKVQGRFEDIPFVDSAAATRSLIASALVHSSDRTYSKLRRGAAQRVAAEADAYGLPTVADAAQVAACYPLHPSTLLVLPELCARYGQNERTLFSFLASGEARSVMAFALAETVRDPLPWVRLDRVYDYFVESASTFVGASRDASRWIEVETTIRDAHGLIEAQRRVLKSVGVLNLIAAGGTLRASPGHVAYAAADGQPGTDDVAAVDSRLAELEQAGLLVFRDFASCKDEHREQQPWYDA
jgi:ABC-type molybdenum transport system ATPase subunit/photorepair protein PhrA